MLSFERKNERRKELEPQHAAFICWSLAAHLFYPLIFKQFVQNVLINITHFKQTCLIRTYSLH